MLVEVNNLCISYNNNHLIKNLSFEIDKGEILGIIGKNGSGKTSLCLALLGLLQEASVTGSVSIEKRSVESMSVEQRCQSLGIIFQQPDEQMFAPTVEDEIVFGMENLCIEREIMKKRMDEVLNLLGIENLQKSLINNLSAGQKQMVAIASVLAMRPKVLIADEITSALDIEKRDKIRALLRTYAQTNAVIMVAHNQEDLEMCDKILRLGDENGD